jgi:hypothetical protein
MKLFAFDLVKKNGGVIECILRVDNGKATFIFEDKLKLSSTEKGQKLVQQVEDIQNPVGFIIDRMQRIAKRNDFIDSLLVDGKTVPLTDDVIAGEGKTEAVFVGNHVIPQGGQLVVTILDKNGDTVTSTNYSYNDCVSSKAVLSDPKSVTVPLKTDDKGNPRYTRNEYINKVLFAGKVPVGEDAKKLARLLSHGEQFMADVVKVANEKGITDISSTLLERVCDSTKKFWKERGVNMLDYYFRTCNSTGKYRFPVDALTK